MEGNPPQPPPAEQRSAWWRLAPITVILLLLADALSLLVAGVGHRNQWFDQLRQPLTAGGMELLRFVWPVMSALLGVAWAMILVSVPTTKRLWGLISFYLGGVLYLLWLPVFLLTHDLMATKYMLSAALLLAIASGALFFEIRRVAGLLLIPYLAWLTFVTGLMVAIHRLNPAASGSLILSTESSLNAVREENRRRPGQGRERDRGDFRGDEPRDARGDPRQDPRLDREQRGSEPG